MDTPQDPLPRVGDRDRDRAVEYLQEHMAAGRLDATEFDERMSAALAARTEADLLPLFLDLPAPRLGGEAPRSALQPATPTPTPVVRQDQGMRPLLRVAGAVAWPAAIIGASVLGWGQFWWFVFIPIFLVPALVRSFGGEDEDEEEDTEGEDGEWGDQRDGKG